MPIRINEVFCSILGESTFSGLPCAIVRLTGCNLRCTYCDTEYAYDKGIEMSVEQIVRSIGRFDVAPVLITGGEPLLQSDVYELMNRLMDLGHIVLVETNGSVDIGDVPGDVVTVMDLKCPGSGENEKMILDNLDFISGEDNLKFVLMDYKDYSWAVDIIDEYELDTVCSVLMSPVMGVLDPRELSRWMIEDRLMARLHLQLHKIVWGSDVQGR